MEGVVGIAGSGNQSQICRKEWRAVTETTARGRLMSTGQARMSLGARHRLLPPRRVNRNDQLYQVDSNDHSIEHSSGDLDRHQLDPSSPTENQGREQTVEISPLYQASNGDHSLNPVSLDLSESAMEDSEEVLQQRLHDIASRREQLQQAELELRAQLVARSEMMRMQHGFEEQSKHHNEIVNNLQEQLQERDQQICHLEQQLKEREQQLRANQIEATEAVSKIWAKDGLLREQTNELASLRRDRDNALAEQKAVAAQFDVERSELLAQLDNSSEQLREKDRRLHEMEEQLRDAQAWITRAQELDAYHITANNCLHAELRDRTDQMNHLWLTHQRQLADLERYYTQVLQSLQQEITEAREQKHCLIRISDNNIGISPQADKDPVRFGDDGPNSRAFLAIHSKANSGIISNGIVDGVYPVMITPEPLGKVEHATGLPVLPTPLMGMAPVIPPSGNMAAMHQFGMQQQALPSAIQPPLQFPQPALGQLQPMPPVILSQQHLASLKHQQGSAQHHYHHQQYLPSSAQRHPMRHLQQQQHMVEQKQILQGPMQSQHQNSSEQDQQQQAPSQTKTDSEIPERELSEVQPQTHHTVGDVVHKPQAAMFHPVIERSKPMPPQSMQEEQSSSIQHHHKQEENIDQENQEMLLAQNQNISCREEQQGTMQDHIDAHSILQSSQLQESKFQLAQDLGHEETSGNRVEQPGTEVQTSVSTQSPTCLYQVKVSKFENPEAKNLALLTHKQQYALDEGPRISELPLLDERSLLACLIRAIPAESSARIRISSTLPNRLGKMLAPLHWHDYRKQYGRLDEFVASYPELFVIEGDFIHLKEGAHATVLATTAVAKVAAAAAALVPGTTQLPSVALTPVAPRLRSSNGRQILSSSQSPSSGSKQNQDSPNGYVLSNGSMNRQNFAVKSVNFNGKSDIKGPPALMGSKENGRISNPQVANGNTYGNGLLDDYSISNVGTYYKNGQQGRSQEIGARPQTQEGRILGATSVLAQ